MASQDEKRARIIAAQKEREEAERTAGRLPTLPEPKKNWAASSSKRPRRPGPGRPPSRQPR